MTSIYAARASSTIRRVEPTWVGSASMYPIRRTSPSSAAWTRWAIRPTRSCRCPPTSLFGCTRARSLRPSARDRAAGLTPLAIAATAGTTNTGAVDALRELADLAEREALWLHVDAAYGGAARLSERLAGQVDGLERADSITIDPHKWFFQAYDIGGLLVRDGSLLETTFSYRPEYYRGSGDPRRAPDAHGSDELDFYRLSIEGTRRQRSLKLWLSWKHLGTRGLGRLVERTVDLAAALASQGQGER